MTRQTEALTKTVKKLVLDMDEVAGLKASTIQELRNLVCDAWLYGMQDGTRLTDGEHDKMQAWINAAAKIMRRNGLVTD